MKRKLIVEVIAFLLMLLFLFASVSKWLAFKTFIGDINNQPFPNWLTPWITNLLPPIEVLIVLALMFEKTRTAGFYASLILMTAFSIYSAAVLLKFFDYIPCSCGGIIKNLSWRDNLILNLFFVAISIAGILLRKNRFRKEGHNKQMAIPG
jgi:putative oxidoreductase